MVFKWYTYVDNREGDIMADKHITRYHPSIHIGLKLNEVKRQRELSLINYNNEVSTKSIKQIISGNIFTLFNLLNVLLALTIILVGSYKNLLFLGVVICNTFISTFQEIRSKKIIDKLSLLSQHKAKVIRNRQEKKIVLNDIVLDDIIKFSLGDQVVVDAIIRDGNCEVNEAFITGEAKPRYKQKGDLLLSGSFIVSGNVVCQVEHVGTDNYTSVISKEAKYIKKVNSEIMNSLKKIIKIVSLLILPLGSILFYRQLQIVDNTLSMAVVNTVAAIIGMIPEGLMLLTSTVLAVSVIRLSKYNVLVQQLYCIETLARVDTLCLDKTGTITNGHMEVADVIPLDGHTSDQVDRIMCGLTSALEDNNPTFVAIRNKFTSNSNFKSVKVYPFSSDKKYSGAKFRNEGTYILGAPEVLLNNDIGGIQSRLDEYVSDNRVLLLIKVADDFVNNKFYNIDLIALILVRDQIRDSALETINYFKKQKVDIRIISGDNPITIASTAKRVGISLDDSQIVNTSSWCNYDDIVQNVEKYKIFGRVKPNQKQLIIRALKENGHTVAMTGDGVNDVLAMKESDCAIAMNDGSDAARNVAELVLLDSNFLSMPKIVSEGRRTINNIARSATLFLSKTIYAFLLALVFLFVNLKYPFMPIQLSLISSVTIGIPAFILALEPNQELVSGNFLKKVISRALPSGITTVLTIIMVVIMTNIFHLSPEQSSTLAVILTSYVGLQLIYRISHPFNRLRRCLFAFLIILFAILILGAHELFSITKLNFLLIIIMLFLMMVDISIFNGLFKLVDNFMKKHQKWFDV